MCGMKISNCGPSFPNFPSFGGRNFGASFPSFGGSCGTTVSRAPAQQQQTYGDILRNVYDIGKNGALTTKQTGSPSRPTTTSKDCTPPQPQTPTPPKDCTPAKPDTPTPPKDCAPAKPDTPTPPKDCAPAPKDCGRGGSRSEGNRESSQSNDSNRSKRGERSDRGDRSNGNSNAELRRLVSQLSNQVRSLEQRLDSSSADSNRGTDRGRQSHRNEDSGRTDRSHPTKGANDGVDQSCTKSNGNDRDLGWDVVGANGVATISLGNRYEIAINEQNASWTLKDKDCGTETKVSGDPHVDVGNNGSTDFDFKKDATFQLEDGTKISVGTTQWENTDAYVSSTLTITNGNNAIKVTGLGDKADGADNLWIVESKDGRELDQQTNDGAFTAVKAGAGWKVDGQDVTQALINAKEAAAA